MQLVFSLQLLALIVCIHVHNIDILVGCMTCLHVYTYAVDIYSTCLHSGSYMCMYVCSGSPLRC